MWGTKGLTGHYVVASGGIPAARRNPEPPVFRRTVMWAVSDDALLAGLASGDAEAATAFVARFQRRVYGLAFTMMGDSRAAEDVAQEAFVRAWRHAGAFDARRGSVVTWLLTITRNLAIDSMRVRRPVAVDPDTVFQMPIVATEPGPEQRAGQQEDADRLHAALAQLPEEQRRAIVLAGLLGHSAREVGELEGIPLGTAKTRIRTALMRLRTALVAEEQ
jgi:RNA polymerase sigma factor (sigma-70 family)